MTADVSIKDITGLRESTWLHKLIASQAFWVSIAILIICVVMTFTSDAFATTNNLFNITRNFAFIGIIALGMTAVIITAGIDLSVGSVMGLSGVVTGLVLEAGWPLYVGSGIGLLVALAAGTVNGVLIAYLRLPPFVVTLGMLSIARSLALVVSNNKMVYKFGPDEELYLAIGGGTTFGIANPMVVLILLTILFSFAFNFTAWGRYVYAIGGNEQAARLTGVPVERIKLSVYMLCSLMAGFAAILMVGWLGASNNALGMNYELQVIAATVIGGANLMGGEGGAFGAVIGAALMEVIRNSLILAGVDPYWQRAFVGLFVILAVLLERIRGRQSN